MSSMDGGRTFRTTAVALNDSEVSSPSSRGLSLGAGCACSSGPGFDPSLPSDCCAPTMAVRPSPECSRGPPERREPSPDGATIWARDAGRVYRSEGPRGDLHAPRRRRRHPTRGSPITRAASTPAAYPENQYGVLVSTDDGASFSFYLRFPDVTAPLACAAGTTAGSACATRFEDWRIEQGLPGPGSGGAGGQQRREHLERRSLERRSRKRRSLGLQRRWGTAGGGRLERARVAQRCACTAVESRPSSTGGPPLRSASSRSSRGERSCDAGSS